MDNYLVVNGIKIELTEEQLKALGIKTNAFSRKSNQIYYFIDEYGDVGFHHDNTTWDATMYNIANYCTDKTLMEQRALHETLNRLLWRFSMEHDGEKIDWKDFNSLKYTIFYNHRTQKFKTNYSYWMNFSQPYFLTEKIAKQAIEEIIKPFMKEHPEFKW